MVWWVSGRLVRDCWCGMWMDWLGMRSRIISGLWWEGLVGVAGREGGEIVGIEVG